MSEQATREPRLLLRLGLTVLLLLLGGCCLGFVSLYFSAGDHGTALFSWYLTQPMVLVLNLIPFVLLVLLLYAALDRAWLAFLLGGAVELVSSSFNTLETPGRAGEYLISSAVLRRGADEVLLELELYNDRASYVKASLRYKGAE